MGGRILPEQTITIEGTNFGADPGVLLVTADEQVLCPDVRRPSRSQLLCVINDTMPGLSAIRVDVAGQARDTSYAQLDVHAETGATISANEPSYGACLKKARSPEHCSSCVQYECQ